MPDHPAIYLCDERDRECLGGAERHDDELLRVIADLQGSKRGNGHFGYRAHIGIGLVPDNNLRMHGFLVFLSCRPPVPFFPSRRASAIWNRVFCTYVPVTSQQYLLHIASKGFLSGLGHVLSFTKRRY